VHAFDIKECDRKDGRMDGFLENEIPGGTFFLVQPTADMDAVFYADSVNFLST
jgi:hypothetical protein